MSTQPFIDILYPRIYTRRCWRCFYKKVAMCEHPDRNYQRAASVSHHWAIEVECSGCGKTHWIKNRRGMVAGTEENVTTILLEEGKRIRIQYPDTDPKTGEPCHLL